MCKCSFFLLFFYRFNIILNLIFFFFIQIMNTHCFNCSRDAMHLAMYCDNKPQKIRRCGECWAAASRDADHSFSCYSRIIYRELSANDHAHRIQPRILVRTDGVGLRGFENAVNTIPSISTAYKSHIAGNISYHWPNQRGFCVMGPRTMYFRLPIIVGDNVALRIDVLFDSMNVIIVNQPINRISAISNVSQTVCGLRIAKMPQTIDVLMPAQAYFIEFHKINDDIVVKAIKEAAIDFDVENNIRPNLNAIEQ